MISRPFSKDVKDANGYAKTWVQDLWSLAEGSFVKDPTQKKVHC